MEDRWQIGDQVVLTNWRLLGLPGRGVGKSRRQRTAQRVQHMAAARVVSCEQLSFIIYCLILSNNQGHAILLGIVRFVRQYWTWGPQDASGSGPTPVFQRTVVTVLTNFCLFSFLKRKNSKLLRSLCCACVCMSTVNFATFHETQYDTLTPYFLFAYDYKSLGKGELRRRCSHHCPLRLGSKMMCEPRSWK